MKKRKIGRKEKKKMIKIGNEMKVEKDINDRKEIKDILKKKRKEERIKKVRKKVNEDMEKIIRDREGIEKEFDEKGNIVFIRIIRGRGKKRYRGKEECSIKREWGFRK